MLTSHPTRAHVLVAREASAGTIAGSIVGACIAAILILVCSLPFILKCRRKRRARKRRQEEDAHRPEMDGVRRADTRPPSQTFSTHANRLSHMSNSRLASAAATLSDHDSQVGKEVGPDGMTYHRSAAPSPALVGMALRSCSPAPSVVLAASRKNSPAIVQAPFTPPPEPGINRSATFATLTAEPETISRSNTEPLSRSTTESHPRTPTGFSFRKIHDKIMHRDSTRTSENQSRKNTRSSTMDFDDLGPTQTGASEHYLVDDKPVMGGSAEEYYSGAPLSPPEEARSSPPPNSQFLHLMKFPAAATAALAGVGLPQAEQASGQQQSRTLGSPFNAPLSPSSPGTRDDDQSSGGEEQEERQPGMRSMLVDSGTLSPPHQQGGLTPSSPKRFEPPPSPSHPDPGTVNPMDMMRPTLPAEQAAFVNTELWKLDNSPPLPIDNSPPLSFEPMPSSLPPFSQQQPYQQQQPLQQPTPPTFPEPYYEEPETFQEEPESYQQQPTPVPERPQFQAVVRHPTQMDFTTGGEAIPQYEEQVITDISETSSPGPAFDQYAYAPSPSNHTSPDTKFTDSAYTGSPSPRSSMNSQRPTSIYGGTDYHLGTSPAQGDRSRPSSQGDGSSPKPTSFACEQCGSKFDQVHKLK